MVLMIDNYDSFTYNVVQYLGELGADVKVVRNDELTVAEVFAANDYRTGMFGKWHLGENYPLRPEDQGFDTVVRHGGGGVGQGPDYWGNDYFDDTYWRERNDPAWEDTSIQRHLPALKEALADLKADPEIAALHVDAVRLHRAKRDALMAQPAYAQMYDQLRAAPALPPGEPELIEQLGLAS